jgi:hypothetical protein
MDIVTTSEIMEVTPVAETGSFWDIFTSTPVAEMTGIQILLLAGFLWLAISLVKALFKPAKRGVEVAKNVGTAVVHPYRTMCAHETCLHCGRTLDKCVCASNKGVSYRKRLKKHRSEKKLIKLQQRAGR